jgi:alpha-N-arabinofuranosidase
MPFQAERDSYTPEFCFGGITRFEKQLVGARDEQGGRDFRDEVARGSGKPGQSKVLRYVPTEPGSDQVFVGGEPWQRVDDLSAATGKVYRIEPKTGTILFGDGTRGDAPPQGAEIAASYRARRWGFVDYYAAMKKVDPTIRIYAGYESLNIVRTLGSKHPYDGVVVHPYTAQYKVPKADTLEDWHHNLMLSSDRLGHEVREYQELIDKTVTPERRGKVHVICTEFGALNQNQVMPAGNSEGYWRFLNIGLYTGAQLLEFMRIGVPQAHRHATTVGVLGPAPQFEMSPTALAYQVFTHHFGDRLIGIKLENNPVRPTRTAHQEGVGVNDKLIRMDSPKLPPGAQPLGLPRLNAEASRDAAGNVYVLVINQDATEDVSARIDIAGAAAKGDAEIWTLNGPSFQAVNTPQNPEAVRIRTESRAVTGPFRHTFPAHSLTAIRFSREKKP